MAAVKKKNMEMCIRDRVGSGKKVYLPVVSQRKDGDESTTKVNNSDSAVASSYDEEEVCQEIEDQLGVLPVRLGPVSYTHLLHHRQNC